MKRYFIFAKAGCVNRGVNRRAHLLVLTENANL